MFFCTLTAGFNQYEKKKHVISKINHISHQLKIEFVA